MTLEKLLMFGFALAVFIALTLSASTIMSNREPSNQKYQDRVTDMVGKATK